MSKNPQRQHRATLPLVRCAVYTRKSTEEPFQVEQNRPPHTGSQE